jgi:hypothetical protein
MPWYFYSGAIACPVRRIDGEIVSVRPRSKVEAKHEDVRKFGSKMSRCAPPESLPVHEEPLAAPGPGEISPSRLAQAVLERGVTKDPAVAPSPAEVVEEKGAELKPRRSRPKNSTGASE